MRTPNLKRLIGNCKNCGLALSRRSIVIGRGAIPSDVLFLGEGPGQVEDATGIPFYGVSGKMLDKLIEQTEIKFSYYISNSVLCHPTDSIGGSNREPSPNEVLSCTDNVSRIYDAVQPKLVIFVGKIAERFYKKRFKPHITILHPSYILRTGGKASPHYLFTLNKIREAVECFAI